MTSPGRTGAWKRRVQLQEHASGTGQVLRDHRIEDRGAHPALHDCAPSPPCRSSCSPRTDSADKVHALDRGTDDNGHCYLPEPNLLTDAAEIMQVGADLVVLV